MHTINARLPRRMTQLSHGTTSTTIRLLPFSSVLSISTARSMTPSLKQMLLNQNRSSLQKINYVQCTFGERFAVERWRHFFQIHRYASTSMIQIAPWPNLCLDEKTNQTRAIRKESRCISTTYFVQHSNLNFHMQRRHHKDKPKIRTRRNSPLFRVSSDSYAIDSSNTKQMSKHFPV